MSRGKSGHAVSLFPFLAVLVSAMGALIFLLVAVSYKAHKDAVVRAEVEHALAQSQHDAEVAAARNAIPLPLPADHPAFQTDAAEFVIAIKSPAKQLLPPPAPKVPDRTLEKEKLRQQWEAKLAAIHENWESLQQRLQAGQKLVSRQAQQEADLAAELARLQEAINKLQAEKGDLKQEVKTVKTTKHTIAQQVAELQAELARLQIEKAAQADKFQLVPYVGNSPTHRRPIIIACEAKSVRFASEEISLSARDLSGFSGDYNPARAGTEALLNYWETQRQQSSSLAARPPEPYLLFVIRPGGTVSYYVTRRLLEGLKVDSGYELVPQSQELVWPVSTPDAKAACQTAINKALAERKNLTAKTADGRLPVAEELQYEGKGGEFILSEVQKLRNPEPKTFVGGQRITRQERSRSGTGSYKPPTAPADETGGFVGPRLEDLKDEMGNLPSRRANPQEGQAARQPGRQPGSGPPFPTEPPPRTGGRSTGDVASTDAVGLRRGGFPGRSQTPGRSHQPSGTSQQSGGVPQQPGTARPPGTPVDPDRVLAMNPDELDRELNGSPDARGPVGNFGGARPGMSGRDLARPGGEGRGAGDSSGEATSQFADRGAMNDLLSSQTDQTQSPSLQSPSLQSQALQSQALQSQAPSGHGQPHGSSSGRKPSPQKSGSQLGSQPGSQPGGYPGGQSSNQSGGQPGGDRTSAVETTDDPSLMGDSTPNGVVGGKGTFSGAGGSSAAAPDHIPVQPGGAPGASGGSGAGGSSGSGKQGGQSGQSGGRGGPQRSPGLRGSPSSSDSTEAMLAQHLPRPLPEPATNSVAAERYVVVTIDSESIQVGSHEIPLEEGMSNRVLETQFSKELALAAKRWGRPPAGFHWQPALRFRVLPGGNQYYAWLHSASQEWELRNTVEYVFE